MDHDLPQHILPAHVSGLISLVHAFTVPTQRYVDMAFKKLDEDGDGFISLDELLEYMPSVASSTGTAIPHAERIAEVGNEEGFWLTK